MDPVRPPAPARRLFCHHRAEDASGVRPAAEGLHPNAIAKHVDQGASVRRPSGGRRHIILTVVSSLCRLTQPQLAFPSSVVFPARIVTFRLCRASFPARARSASHARVA